MIKHPPADDNEAALAALAYMPGLALLVLFSLEPGQPHYFIRYHAAHAILLNAASLVALLAAAGLGLIPGASTTAYLVMGGAISLVLILATLLHGLAALRAYRRRLVVLPLVTPLYYRFFNKT